MNSTSDAAVAPVGTTASQVAQHLGYLDGLRAVAAIYVILHHSFLQIADNPSYKAGMYQRFGFFDFGRYAVDIFIVLSGFCLMLPVVRHDGILRGGTLQFYKRRALRILPTYYCAVGLSLLLIWTLIGQKTQTHWDISIPVSLKSVLYHLLLIHDMTSQGGNINHSFWSIAVEWRIYFLFPLLVILWRRIGPWMTTALSIIVSAMLSPVFVHFIGYSLTVGYVGLFALGMLATTFSFSATESFQKIRSRPWGAMTLALTCVVLAMSGIMLKTNSLIPVFLSDLIIGIWTLSLLVWLSCGANWGRGFLGSAPLVWLGTFAYSLYLVHAPLIQMLWQYPFARLQQSPVAMFAALALIGTPVIIGLSYLFFLVCERPMLRKKAVARPETLVVKTTLEPAP